MTIFNTPLSHFFPPEPAHREERRGERETHRRQTAEARNRPTLPTGVRLPQ